MRDITKFRDRERAVDVDFDLSIPEHSYIFGLVLTDGSFSWKEGVGKGKIAIELRERDRDILEKIKRCLGVKTELRTRTRETNFKEATSTILTINDLHFRQQIHACGMPLGKKALLATPPSSIYLETDFWRGVIDGDGSLGLTGQGFPFLSLVTISESLAEAYLAYLLHVFSIKKTCSRNARDGAYNIMITKEDARKVAATLYYTDCMAIAHKVNLAQVVMAWERPKWMKKVTGTLQWTDEQDSVVRMHSIEDSARILGRTKSSIVNRRFRLRRKYVVSNSRRRSPPNQG